MKLKSAKFLIACIITCILCVNNVVAKDGKKAKVKKKESIPIDGGISVLLAAGVALGARKIIMSRKTNIE